MIWLITLKNIFSQQLPNMPREYIARLVLDRYSNMFSHSHSVCSRIRHVIALQMLLTVYYQEPQVFDGGEEWQLCRWNHFPLVPLPRAEGGWVDRHCVAWQLQLQLWSALSPQIIQLTFSCTRR